VCEVTPAVHWLSTACGRPKSRKIERQVGDVDPLAAGLTMLAGKRFAAVFEVKANTDSEITVNAIEPLGSARKYI
jgi:hypothetical protein